MLALMTDLGPYIICVMGPGGLEAKLNLDLTFATAQLSYANAMALKRGHPNGEVEQGISAYEAALAAYRKFEREQVVDSLEG